MAKPKTTPPRNAKRAQFRDERWLHFYRQMLKIRLFEEEVNQLYLGAKMPGLAHLYIGEEAVAVGVCEALRRDDYITSTHRGHGHCIAKGASIDKMFAELLGKAAGYCRGKGGSMLHFSSCVTAGIRNRAAYSASKGAVISLTKSMALDYAGDNIRVNCLCPGFVDTPLLAQLPPERKAKIAASHPLGRLGRPEDIVPMALLLLSDQGAWITGQAIGVDGGFNAGHHEDI